MVHTYVFIDPGGELAKHRAKEAAIFQRKSCVITPLLLCCFMVAKNTVMYF